MFSCYFSQQSQKPTEGDLKWMISFNIITFQTTKNDVREPKIRLSCNTEKKE